jgi:hypothetical protein
MAILSAVFSNTNCMPEVKKTNADPLSWKHKITTDLDS